MTRRGNHDTMRQDTRRYGVYRMHSSMSRMMADHALPPLPPWISIFEARYNSSATAKLPTPQKGATTAVLRLSEGVRGNTPPRYCC